MKFTEELAVNRYAQAENIKGYIILWVKSNRLNQTILAVFEPVSEIKN